MNEKDGRGSDLHFIGWVFDKMKLLLFKYLTYMTDVLALKTLRIVASRHNCVIA